MAAAKGSFDPETLALLKSVFNQACALLPQHRRKTETQSTIAIRILQLAAEGERDPNRLLSHALNPAECRRHGP